MGGAWTAESGETKRQRKWRDEEGRLERACSRTIACISSLVLVGDLDQERAKRDWAIGEGASGGSD